MFFSGTNSMDFYRKANLRKRLGIKFNIEMVLLPREMLDAAGKTFVVTVGNIHPWAQLKGAAQDLTNAIKEEAYMLCKEDAPLHDLPSAISADGAKNPY